MQENLLSQNLCADWDLGAGMSYYERCCAGDNNKAFSHRQVTASLLCWPSPAPSDKLCLESLLTINNNIFKSKLKFFSKFLDKQKNLLCTGSIWIFCLILRLWKELVRQERGIVTSHVNNWWIPVRQMKDIVKMNVSLSWHNENKNWFQHNKSYIRILKESWKILLFVTSQYKWWSSRVWG